MCGILVFMAQEGLVPCAVKTWKVMGPTHFSFSDPSLLHLLRLFRCVLQGGRGKGGSFFVPYERLKGWFCIFFFLFFFCPVCFLFHKFESECIAVDALFEDRSFPGSQLQRKQILIKNRSGFYTQQKKLQLILGEKFVTKESTVFNSVRSESTRYMSQSDRSSWVKQK